MTSRTRRWVCLVGIPIFLGLLLGLNDPASAEDQDGEPQIKLAVVVVFDQFRGDYLQKWEKHFLPDGFKRLLQDGAWYQNCHYPYAFTITAAGHTSLMTGC